MVKKLETKLEALLAPVVTAAACELYSIERLKERGDQILRIYIDKEGGVTLDDCERVSRQAEVILDQEDLMGGEYRLQVSSPGIERKLSAPHHFIKYIGHRIEVKLFAPFPPPNQADAKGAGRKKFTGKLLDFKDNQLTIKEVEPAAGNYTESSGVYTFDMPQVSACRLVVFD